MRQKQHGWRAEKEVRSEEALNALMAGREAGEGVWKRRGSREDKKEESRGIIVWMKDQTWRSSQRKRVLRDELEGSAG